MAIPGLHHIPIEESSSTCEAIQLSSFDLKSFTVPGAHRYGKCRPISEFDRICVIGEGTYGTVYKVKDRISDNIVALKRLKIAKETEFMSRNFLREITNLKLLRHDNIVNLLGIAVGKNFESTYLILEFCEYELSSVIDELEPQILQQPQIKNIMHQLFTGVDYIHKNFVFHRDLSPSNILFTSSGILKITDFGLSRKISPGNVTPNVGLRWYKAPEILFGSIKYTSTVDIWSCGCILAEMIKRKALFHGNSDSDVIKLIIDFLGTPTESLWPGYSSLPVPQNYDLRLQPYNRIRSTFQSEASATIALLQRTLLYNPSSRASAEQCLQHGFFKDSPLACSQDELVETLKATKAVQKVQVIIGM